MNLEIVGSVAGIKYLFKYINKGSDRVLVSTDDGKTAPNEVKNYVNGKYTSGSESLWRINGFPINWMYPSVEKLDLHLDGEQDVFLKKDTNLKAAAKKKSETQLTAWFKLNDRTTITRNTQPKYCPVRTRTMRYEKSPLSYLTSLLNN